MIKCETCKLKQECCDNTLDISAVIVMDYCIDYNYCYYEEIDEEDIK